MEQQTTAQKQMSLRAKATGWLAAILLVTLISIGIATAVGQWTVKAFDTLLEDNAACYAVQDAIKEETRAFEHYVREPSQESSQTFADACAAAEESLAALPFDYAKIGEDRYARTWSLRQGYAGYQKARDAFLQLAPSAEDYVERMYAVMDQQDYLAEYALRLTQATLEQENTTYSSHATRLQRLPWLYFGLLAAAVALMLLLIRVLNRAAAAAGAGVPQHCGRRLHRRGPADAQRRRGGPAHRHLQPHEARHGGTPLHPERPAPGGGAESGAGKGPGTHPAGSAEKPGEPAFSVQHPEHDLLYGPAGRCVHHRPDDRAPGQPVPAQPAHQAAGSDAGRRTGLEDYIYLQQMRFDGRITVEKKIEADPAAVRLPSFTLQPIVENAFSHGLKSCEEGGRILLRGWMQGRTLILTVADNGRGMTPAELDALQEKIAQSERTGRSIGLGNISRRITMLYPEGRMQVFSREGHGTVIRFEIPQEDREEDGSHEV